MKPRKRQQFIDENEPERAFDWLAKCHRREARRSKRLTSDAISWLGRLLYYRVADLLLTDPANFDSEGMPTEKGLELAKNILVDAAINLRTDLAACDAEGIFRRELLQRCWEELVD